MRMHPVLLVMAALSLAGCDAATQIAGEAVQGEVRNAVAAQCRQIAESTGIVAARVADVCECSAETFVRDGQLTPADISPAKIEGIVNECAKRTGARTGTATSTETIGG